MFFAKRIFTCKIGFDTAENEPAENMRTFANFSKCCGPWRVRRTRVPLSRLQTTFWHCSLTLETTKKRLETRDYKKMRFRRAAAVTFFVGGDAEVLRAGVPHFFLRAARGYVFSLYFGLYHQYYLRFMLATQTYGAFYLRISIEINHIIHCIWKLSALRALSSLETRDYNFCTFCSAQLPAK